MHKVGDRVMGSIGSKGLREKEFHLEQQLMPLLSLWTNAAAGSLNYGQLTMPLSKEENSRRSIGISVRCWWRTWHHGHSYSKSNGGQGYSCS